MQRFTLTYLTQRGKKITLYNLGSEGVKDVIRAQQHLGSTNFNRVEQSHNYSQQEIDLLRDRATA